MVTDSGHALTKLNQMFTFPWGSNLSLIWHVSRSENTQPTCTKDRKIHLLHGLLTKKQHYLPSKNLEVYERRNHPVCNCINEG